MNIGSSLFSTNNYDYNNKYKSKSSLADLFSKSQSMQNVSNNKEEKDDVIPEGMSEERYWEIKEKATAVKNFEATGGMNGNKTLCLFGAGDDNSLGSFSGHVGATGPQYAANFYYAEHSTPENPCVIAEGFDEYGNVFYEEIYTNDVDPSSANMLEAHALCYALGVDATPVFLGSEHGVFDKVDIYQEAKEIYNYQSQYGSIVQKTLDQLEDIMNTLEKHAHQNGVQYVDSSKSNYRAPVFKPNTPAYIKQAYYKLSYNNYFAS
ncbi:hypothetical protein AN641_08790 [Candidatus Epulonipiscioides gigas]|nr:hypothetical protein AN641_08790 [Epulopiscium sp. SCG-C07WGA-EpuloA2]